MNWLNDTLTTFGEGMGLTGLQLNQEGLLCLEFEHSGLLTVEAKADHVLVYLGRPLIQLEQTTLLQALRLCHYSTGHTFPLQIGLARGNVLVLAVRLAARECSPHRLEAVVKLLQQTQESLF